MKSILQPLRLLCVLVALMGSLAFGDTRLRVGQAIRFYSASNARMNVTRVVLPGGEVLLPVAGAVSINSRSLEKFLDDANDRLAKTGSMPDLKAQLIESAEAPITFSGAVELIGALPGGTKLSLGDLLKEVTATRAGDARHVRLTSATGKVQILDALGAAASLMLRPGDSVEVPIAKAPDTVTVLGGVKRPGAVEYEEGMNVAKAIDAAGGFAGHADPSQLSVYRGGKTTDVAAGAELQPGDKVKVGLSLDRRFVAVKGAVKRPGVVEYFDGMTLSQAVEAAGGLADFADSNHVERFIFPSNKRQVFSLDKILKKKDKDVKLGANDTLVVVGKGGGN